MEKLLVFGNGLQAEELTAFIEEYALFNIVAYTVDERFIKSSVYLGKPVYPAERIEEYVRQDVLAYVAVSQQFYANRLRVEKYIMMRDRGYHFANIISPRATLKCELIGEGNWIKDNAYLDYKTTIGSNNLIGIDAQISHFSVLGDHNYLASKCLIAGACKIGNQNYFGIGSKVYNVLEIGDKCIIAGGAVVKKSLPSFSLCTIPGCDVKQEKEEMISYYVLPIKRG